MYIKEIEYMLSILHHGNISKAAEELYISQPALSKYLKNVERQVGSPLFSRLDNELVPTHMGTRYLHYAATISRLQDDWNLERSDLFGEERGQMSLTIPPMRSFCIVPNTVPAFWKKYPNVKVSIMEESNLVQKQLLTERGIDFVIHSDTAPSSSFQCRELGGEEVVLLMSKGHRLTKYAQQKKGRRYPWIDLRLVKDMPFALNPHEQTTGKVSARLLEEAGITPHMLIQTRNTGVSMQLAERGTALAFAPETYVSMMSGDKPLCFSVGETRPDINLYALYQSGRYLPAYIRYYLDLVEGFMATAVTNSGRSSMC